MEEVYKELRRVVAYAEALEREIDRLGNPIASPRNVTLERAKELLRLKPIPEYVRAHINDR